MSFLSSDITPAHLQKQITILNTTLRQLTNRVKILEQTSQTPQTPQTQQTHQTQLSTVDKDTVNDEDTCTLQ
jgi:hypothetical protein